MRLGRYILTVITTISTISRILALMDIMDMDMVTLTGMVMVTLDCRRRTTLMLDTGCILGMGNSGR